MNVAPTRLSPRFPPQGLGPASAIPVKRTQGSLEIKDTPSPYRGTSLIKTSAPPGPYSRTMPRALWWS